MFLRRFELTDYRTFNNDYIRCNINLHLITGTIHSLKRKRKAIKLFFPPRDFVKQCDYKEINYIFVHLS